jgi:hypothetical protein
VKALIVSSCDSRFQCFPAPQSCCSECNSILTALCKSTGHHFCSHDGMPATNLFIAPRT